ncbi:hypothetical protein [Marinobacter shengliensis]|uniref:portal protein n=1 Tax=Marinobacter shengliensis TaxID=1389223 RepID=UPI001E3E59A3|nr:hypothetical protein [Marinobacter shengliensis]MCD1628473.1 hypothetical protein [Marinobacter shengliensis]
MNNEDINNPNYLGDIEVDWENPPSLLDLKNDLEESYSFHGNQVTKIDEWLDNLHVEGKAKPKTTKNRSAVQPKLIRKQAEWRYAALSEPFLSTDDLFEVSPRTWEDTQAAHQNGLVLNHQFNVRIDKNRFIDEYVRTAVDEGTAIIRVGWDYEEEQYTEMEPVIELVPDPAMAELYQELGALQEQNPNEYFRTVPEPLQRAFEASMAEGVPYRPIETGQFEEIEKTRIVRNQPTLDIVDYHNAYVDPTCNGDLNKASFFVYSFEASKSDLEKDGRYSNLDKINLEANTIIGEANHAASTEASSFNFRDAPRKKFVVFEYWGYWDIDGSGVVKPIVASWVGNTLIRLEENPYPDKKIPFVMVSYLPVRKSAYGEPDGALLEDNQKIIGAVTRGMIDILGRSANGQTGMRKDMLDATNKRKYENGQDYEFNAHVDPRQGTHMHTFPEIPQSAQFMLEVQNTEAESLTGVKAFHGGISGAALGDTATGIRGALDAASKRELGILRRLANGLVQVGRKIVSMNAVFLSEEEVIRITNEQFVTVRREELEGEFDLKLSISTAEEDDKKAQEIAFMLQTMGNNIDFSIMKILLGKLYRLRKMPDVAKAIEEFEPQPDPMQQQLQQLQMYKLQAEIAEIAANTSTKETQAILNQAKAITEQAKAAYISADTDQKALDFIEQESGVKQERDLQKQGEQARANMQLKAFDHQLKREDEANKALLQNYLQSNQ